MILAPCRPRENPFRTERLDRLGFRDATTGEPAGRADLGALVERFERLGRRAAVIGPEGSGKTTLLDALEPRLAERGHDVLRLKAAPGGALLCEVPGGGALQGSSPLETAGPRTLLVVDGLDRLPAVTRWRVRRVARGAAGLLATAHRPLRIPTLVECATTSTLLAALIAELTAGQVGQAAGRLPAAEVLHSRHRGNLRTALLELFDLCAGR